MKKYSFLIPAIALAAMPAASSTTVLLDMSTASPPAADTKTWNSLGSGGSDASIADLIDSGGTATGFSLTIDVTNVVAGGTSGAGFGGTAISGPTGPDPFDNSGVTTDGLFANNNSDGTAVFSFTNLAVSTQYNFSAIGGRAGNGKDGEIIILDSPANKLGGGAVGTQTTYTLLNDGTVLDFSLVSSATGEIFFEFRKGDDSVGGTSATINGLSMTQIPEPSAALLGGLGFLMLLRRRR